MTTQPTPRALAREAAGLCLTALGALGALVALGTLHWAAGLSAAFAGMLAAAVLTRPEPSTPRWAHAVRVGAGIAGYGGLTGCAFALCTPLGWLGVAGSVMAIGLWLATREHENEGA